MGVNGPKHCLQYRLRLFLVLSYKSYCERRNKLLSYRPRHLDSKKGNCNVMLNLFTTQRIALLLAVVYTRSEVLPTPFANFSILRSSPLPSPPLSCQVLSISRPSFQFLSHLSLSLLLNPTKPTIPARTLAPPTAGADSAPNLVVYSAHPTKNCGKTSSPWAAAGAARSCP
jgi:hypothetical protein